MEEIVISLYLCYGAIKDGFTKKIPVWYLTLGIVIISLYSWNRQSIGADDYILSLIPGVLFLLYRYVKKDGIGYADGIMLCLLGIWLGKEIWRVCYFSLFFISIFSLLLLGIKKVSLETKLPYYPFLLGAYFICHGIKYV